MREIRINYAAVALAEQQLRTLAASISEEITIPIQGSKGQFVDEMKETVNSINEFRVILADAISKTAVALNNTIVSFKKADEGITYKGE